MAKIEGLAKMLEMFRNRENLTVNEIGMACGVSTRTVYRYLRALDTLRIPITLDDGYRLIKEDTRGCAALERDSLILAVSALTHTFLRSYPLLAVPISPVRRMVTAQIQKLPHGEFGDLFEVAPARQVVAKKRENRILAKFVQAWSGHRKVQIARNGRQKSGLLLPCHIRITNQRLLLIVAESRKARRKAIELDEVASLTISSEKFRPLK